MENPMTWGAAEHVVNEAHRAWQASRDAGSVGLSLAMTVTNALRAEGLLPPLEVPPVPKTPEEKRAFSADWDRRYLEGQNRE